MADAGQYRKVKEIILSDPSRRVVVVSAAGKRHSKDHKITDLLYLCNAHAKYGVDCDSVFEMIVSRYCGIRDELGIQLDLESDFAQLKKRIDKREVSKEELVSRGEYYSAKLMAAYLGFQFVDAADWVCPEDPWLDRQGYRHPRFLRRNAQRQHPHLLPGRQ